MSWYRNISQDFDGQEIGMHFTHELHFDLLISVQINFNKIPKVTHDSQSTHELYMYYYTDRRWVTLFHLSSIPVKHDEDSKCFKGSNDNPNTRRQVDTVYFVGVLWKKM